MQILSTSDLRGTVQSSNKDVHFAEKSLKNTLRTQSNKANKIFLDKSRTLLASKSVVKTIKVAVVVEQNGKSIDLKVMDEFCLSDQDANEEDRNDFITTYSAEKC